MTQSVLELPQLEDEHIDEEAVQADDFVMPRRLWIILMVRGEGGGPDRTRLTNKEWLENRFSLFAMSKVLTD